MALPNIYDSHLKVKKILKSCTHQKQIPAARKCVRNFLNLYKVNADNPLWDELDIELLITQNRLNKKD